MFNMAFGGLRIIENDHLVIGPFEDWANVRSHGRAARRRKRGFKQNIRLYYKPNPNMMKMPDGSLVGHPETVRELRRQLDERP